MAQSPDRVPTSVLVVEDEADQRELIAGILRREGLDVRAASSAEAALERIAEREPDLVLSDWRLPGRSGGELLEELRRSGRDCAFVVMTAYGSIAHAVEAVRLGADDYLAKPFERDELLLAVRRVRRTRELEAENRRLREAIREEGRFGELIGRSPAMQRLYRTIEKVGATDATVLIVGESGTGKELVARTLHRASRRADRPFVAVNCAAIPETLIESELFGHERGAFTGAHRRRPGRFEEAEGGTLFLDEIAAMPLPLQATLLRVLQERRFTRLGGSGEVASDVRVMAASNRDLPELVAGGAFRDDLYYRINVVPVTLPPLRERREDIPLLAAAFLTRFTAQHRVAVAGPLPPAVLRLLMEHRWPGNVRELANVIERLVLLAEDGRLRREDLPEEIRSPAASGASGPFRLPGSGIEWDAMEKSLLEQALAQAGGNRAAASRLLGLSYKQLLYRLAKHGIAAVEEPADEPPGLLK
jgi:two-component system NtrC family response regulator